MLIRFESEGSARCRGYTLHSCVPSRGYGKIEKTVKSNARVKERDRDRHVARLDGASAA